MTDQKIDLEILNTYSDFVLSTYAPGLTTEQSICNCVLSMIGELAECECTRAGSNDELLEAGDVLYYLTQLLRALEIPVSFLAQDLSFTEMLGAQFIPATLSDRTKKHLFWGNQPKYNRYEYTEEIKPALLQVLRHMTFSFDLQTIIEANIDKLAKRKGINNPLKGDHHD
jgi:hypothetical protein